MDRCSWLYRLYWFRWVDGYKQRAQKISPDWNQVALIDGTAAAKKMFILRLTKLIRWLGMLWKLTFKVILLLKESLCVLQITAFLSNFGLVKSGCLDICENKIQLPFYCLSPHDARLLYILHPGDTAAAASHILWHEATKLSYCPHPPPPSLSHMRWLYMYIRPEVSITNLSGCPHRLLALVYKPVLW